ncbi:acetyl-CoA synthetase-like protein [Gymnopus androsaceus JB14]|uniref:Acetyl-CoA synthetase-like protein n=1 Tax=Gymnopus androsaceus JB14 TaxID=1447944 RepID=A0A6A4IJZ6_9AGAR|nr:acetyl-CoA synthetase-like protein [Gymnopus androsaceus JB14]
MSTFKPTAESIPPSNNNELKLKLPHNLPVNYHPLNPLDFLLRAALIYGTKLAIAHPDVSTPVFYTYSVWAQRVQNLAYALIKAGLKPGDRLAVIAPNVPMMADSLQGALAARVILTAINIRLTPGEVAYILDHSGAKLILIDYEYLHLIKGTRIPVVVSNDTGRSEDPYEQFLSDGRRFSAEKGWPGLEMEADENAPAMLCYTSGTTGRYHLMLTLNSSSLPGTYLAAIANAFEGQMNRESTYLWILPMFHAAGWTFPWANTFAFTTQITMRSVNYPLIWKHLLESRVTHYCGAPTVQIGIVNDPAAKHPPQQIKAYIAGAAPTAHLIGSLEQIGITPIHVYGLTFTYGPFTRSYPQESWSSLSLEERSKLIARQGHSFATAGDTRVVYRAEESPKGPVELVDVPKDGKTMGEIVTRGNIVMKEYFNDPDATKKAFRGGYFGSGDLAVMYPDGSAAVLDRSKDIIISGGENASSLSIEQELASHPHVLEVSVIAREHKKWGERPMAFVILHPQHASKWTGRHEEFAKDLISHARKTLPGFACPEWVQIVPELPKTSTGKILKTELRKVVAKL